MAKRFFRHAEVIFRASKSSEMVIIIVQDTLPGFPHTPFRPVDERFPLWGQTQGIPTAKAAGDTLFFVVSPVRSAGGAIFT